MLSFFRWGDCRVFLLCLCWQRLTELALLLWGNRSCLHSCIGLDVLHFYSLLVGIHSPSPQYLLIGWACESALTLAAECYLAVAISCSYQSACYWAVHLTTVVVVFAIAVHIVCHLYLW